MQKPYSEHQPCHHLNESSVYRRILGIPPKSEKHGGMADEKWRRRRALPNGKFGVSAGIPLLKIRTAAACLRCLRHRIRCGDLDQQKSRAASLPKATHDHNMVYRYRIRCVSGAECDTGFNAFAWADCDVVPCSTPQGHRALLTKAWQAGKCFLSQISAAQTFHYA
jgi:hypothetical protein